MNQSGYLICTSISKKRKNSFITVSKRPMIYKEIKAKLIRKILAKSSIELLLVST